MKNRILGMAAALAALSASAANGARVTFGDLTRLTVGGSKFGTTSPSVPRVKRHGRGYTAAEGKRRARRHRNQLRAKGHFRKAVR